MYKGTITPDTPVATEFYPTYLTLSSRALDPRAALSACQRAGDLWPQSFALLQENPSIDRGTRDPARLGWEPKESPSLRCVPFSEMSMFDCLLWV